MDPQKLAGLDPKLREAYQRVMGTVIPQSQAKPDLVQDPAQNQTPPPPAPPTPDPVPQPEPQQEPIQTPTPIIGEPPTAPAEPPTQPPVSEPQSIPTPEPQPAIPPQPEPPMRTNNFVQMNSEVTANPSSPNFSAPAPEPQAQAMTIKKKNGMITPILFGIVSLIFIAIYTLFWTKIFNFQLPFLP